MTEADLLAAIAAAPDEDGPRLVYADWLQERGDPRGELVMLQCAIAGGDEDPELEQRVGQLLERHGARWFGPLHALGADSPRWRRGLIEHLELEAAVLLDDPVRVERIFALAPTLCSLEIPDARGRLDAVLEAPWFGRIRALDLSMQHLDDGAASLLAASPALERLERLELGSNEITDDGVATLATSPHLGALVYLGLETNRVEDDGAVALAESRALTALRELDLTEVNLGKMWDDNDIGPRGGVALAGLPLTRLLLSSNGVGSETLEALAAAEVEVKPLELQLVHVGATDAGFAALAASPRMSELRVLGLSSNPCTEEGALALAASPHLPRDLALDLYRPRGYGPLSADVLNALRERFPRLKI